MSTASAPLRRPMGDLSVTHTRATGAKVAAAKPCATRVPSKVDMVGDWLAAAVAIASATQPPTIIRRLPTRSARGGKIKNPTEYDNANAVATQVANSGVAPNSRSNSGASGIARYS